jgi:hypothetical protein
MKNFKTYPKLEIGNFKSLNFNFLITHEDARIIGATYSDVQEKQKKSKSIEKLVN